MNNVDIFLDKFKTLEQLVKNKYNLQDFESAIIYLSNQNQFRSLKIDLNYIREVRNLLSHNPRISGEYPIIPSDGLIETIDKTISKLNDPPTSYKICKKINEVLYANLNDNIVEIANKMNEFDYSYVPILNKGVVVGVFSESSMFHALLKGETINRTSLLNKEFVSKYCSITDKYQFIDRNMYLEDIQDLFNKQYLENNIITMLFVSESGKESEKLLGIITPYDAMDKD